MSARWRKKIIVDEQRREKAAKSNSGVKGERHLDDNESYRTSEKDKQTRLPSIESVKLSGKSLREASSKDVKLFRIPSLQGRHVNQSQPKMYPRLSGTSVETQCGSSLTSSSVAAHKKSQQKLPASEDRRRSKVDDMKVKGEESREKMRVGMNFSASKFSLEPLQLPEVDLKSPLPKLCDLFSPRQQGNSVSGRNETQTVGWEPFSCVCQHCGLKFGKHSIAIHEKRCTTKQVHPQTVSLTEDNHGTRANNVKAPVARIVTISLGSTQCEQLTVHACLPSRPKTRTLQHSSLRDSGFGLPYIPNQHRDCTTDSIKPNSDTSRHAGIMLCDHCGKIIAADRVNVHSRICKPETLHKVSTSSVRFPSTCDLLRVEQENSRQRQRKTVKKPPTVVCYICGREYGTKSIAIHEPQCLKKFETENQKLPISKRKPLPKKLLEERTKVVRLISKEDQVVAVNGHPTNKLCMELMDETMDLIFQQCYSDFERELVPCKRCGRKFAPDRHEKHEPNCNAKPISTCKSQS